MCAHEDAEALSLESGYYPSIFFLCAEMEEYAS